jgi:hypothetical protein
MVRAIEQGQCAKEVRLMMAAYGGSHEETQQAARGLSAVKPLHAVCIGPGEASASAP